MNKDHMNDSDEAPSDPFGTALDMRSSLPESTVSRTDAIALAGLARRFDRAVTQARARARNTDDPKSVREFRETLVRRQQTALTTIANAFFDHVKKYWQELSAGFFALFSAIGYFYAVGQYSSFGIEIGQYLRGLEDLALIGFLKGTLPLTVLLLLAIWLMSIHYAARAAGSRIIEPKEIKVAHRKTFALLLFAHRPSVLLGTCLLSVLVIFSDFLLSTIPLDTAGISAALANGADEASDNATLQLRLTGDEGRPMKIASLIGTTSDYVFVQLPSKDGKRLGVALARSKVECIGPLREVDKRSAPVNYSVPPCDADLVRGPETTVAAPTVTPPKRTIDGYRRTFAKALGCDVDTRDPRYFETYEFVTGKDAVFECPADAPSCTQRDIRERVTTGLRALLSEGNSGEPDDAAFIAGFASSTAAATYNLDLSERRAHFVHALAGDWPAYTRERGFGEHEWIEALKGPGQRAVLVVLCKRAPREDSSAT